MAGDKMKRILIVEDELDIEELLAAYLRDAGYEVALAGDGVEAMRLFQSETFDLVLLDLMLPRMDGFGVCELIRQRSQVPILMLTALDGEETQLRGFKLDIDDYVTKPFAGGRLLDLTAREFDLLRTFLEAPGRVFTREMLLARLWGYDFYGDGRVVDTHIKNLRRKLGQDYIETVRGVGYRAAKETG